MPKSELWHVTPSMSLLLGLIRAVVANYYYCKITNVSTEALLAEVSQVRSSVYLTKAISCPSDLICDAQ